MAAPKGNKYALGLTESGRPPIFESNKELEDKCISYFNHCEEEKIKATITGLALYLGFESRQSIYDYKDNKEFSYTIKRACLAVENSYELNGTPIDIFALKNMGWEDKHETKLSGEVKTTPPSFIFKDLSKEDAE